MYSMTQKEFEKSLNSVQGLKSYIAAKERDTDEMLWMEFVLFGLSEYSRLNRESIEAGARFADLMGSYFRFNEEGE